MDLKDFSAEFIEKAKSCTSPEEFMKLAAAEGVTLPDEALEDLAGGIIYWLDDCGVFASCQDYEHEFGDIRCDIDPSAAPEAYRLGQVGYADLDW